MNLFKRLINKISGNKETPSKMRGNQTILPPYGDEIIYPQAGPEHDPPQVPSSPVPQEGKPEPQPSSTPKETPSKIRENQIIFPPYGDPNKIIYPQIIPEHDPPQVPSSPVPQEGKPEPKPPSTPTFPPQESGKKFTSKLD